MWELNSPHFSIWKQLCNHKLHYIHNVLSEHSYHPLASNEAFLTRVESTWLELSHIETA